LQASPAYGWVQHAQLHKPDRLLAKNRTSHLLLTPDRLV
jgi:hypothetical protein